MKLGLALGSGGARGWCHVGVINELSLMGIQADVAAGCSMGALVGAAWAADRLEAMEDWARSLTPTRFMSFVDLKISGGGMIAGKAIFEMLEEIKVPENIEDLKRPFIAIATDMVTGREIWLQDGSVCHAVRASVGIPGLFSPHKYRDRWLMDGGMTNPVPGSAARALGADVIVAVNPNARHNGLIWTPKEQPPMFGDRFDLSKILPQSVREMLPLGDSDRPALKAPSYVDVASSCIDIMTDFVRQQRHASDPPHLTLDADLVEQMTVLELYRAEMAIEEGHRIVRENKTAIEHLVEMAEKGHV